VSGIDSKGMCLEESKIKRGQVVAHLLSTYLLRSHHVGEGFVYQNIFAIL